MPSPVITPITPPRVPLIDPNTNLVDRAWYMFFLSLFNGTLTAYDNVNYGPSAESLIASYDAALQALTQNVETQPLPADLGIELTKQVEANSLENCCNTAISELAEIQKQLQALQIQVKSENVDLSELQKQLQALQVQPQFDIGAITAAINAKFTAPVTKTADFTLASNENWVINNKSGSTCVVTLPVASAWVGREVTFQNYQNQLLNSASSNVVPQAGGSAGTSILLAVAGNWATIISDGSNWIIMQAAAYNNLLLE